MAYNNFHKKLLTYTAIIGVGFFGGVLLSHFLSEKKCDDTLKFINPELKCSKKEYVIQKHEYVTVKRSIEAYFAQETAAKRLTRHSVYFRDLDNGPTFGINEKENFVPASLLKLPLLLTYFSLAEHDPSLLSEKLAFEWESRSDLEQFFKPSHSLEPKKPYAIEEILLNMIAYSDNASYQVLIQYLRDIDPVGDLYLETFRDLAIIEPESNLDESIYTKSYASIFRALYNSSYLSKKYSEKALEILSMSDFHDGLVAGVPQNIVVAHKFGERFGLPDEQKELHDCGVVYFPLNPYLLCVMVEGYDFSELSSVIETVSRMVYEEVNSRRIP